MHMRSRKDLNWAEVETVRVSSNPTTAITANGEATVYVHDVEFFVTVQILEDTPAVLSLGTLRRTRTLIWVGQWPKTTFNQKGQKNPMQHGELCTDRCPRIIDRFFQLECKCVFNIVTAGHIWWFLVESSNNTKWQYKHSGSGKPCCETCQCGWRSSQKNLEDEGVLASRDTPLTLIRIEIRNVLPRDRNCEIRKRTKITRAPCRKRGGDAVPRAENFGDLITSDHNVLNEGGKSRHNHRYAAVVQDLTTQWIQSYPCKTKTSLRRRKGVYESFSSRRKSRKSSMQTILWNLANPVKNYHEIIVRQRPFDPRQNGITERAIRRIKEGTSAVLLQSGFDEKWWADSMECHCCLRNVQDLLADGKHSMKGDLENHVRTSESVWLRGRIPSYFRERPVRTPSIW